MGGQQLQPQALLLQQGQPERFSDGRFCEHCPSANQCPFEGSYDQLESQLFAAQAAIRDVPNTRRSNNRPSNNRRGQQDAATVPPWPDPSDKP